MEREKLKSRLGFILISAGCAIGIGNVWKFAYMAGQGGGGFFVLLYLLFLVMLGIPIMSMEFAVGRASQKSPAQAYKALEKAGQKWHIHGYIALIGNYLLMMFYTTVAGWMLYYFFHPLGVEPKGNQGFGVLNDSIASYSLASQIVITTFMIICSINFNVYYLLLIRKTKEAFMNQELRYYLGIVFGSALLIAINIKGSFDNFFMAFHTALFQVASVSSTTGFATTDFNLWPEFSKTILVLLMFVGACAGSTGGGIKVSRLVVFLKAIKSEVMSITHPRSVQKVQTDGRPLSNDAVRRVLCYLGAYVIIVLASILLISLDGKDMTTNLTAVMATFNNIGPGLNLVGPTSNFGDYSVFSKIVLMFDMLVGRLEIFPLLILFAPGLWTVPKRRLAKKKKNFE